MSARKRPASRGSSVSRTTPASQWAGGKHGPKAKGKGEGKKPRAAGRAPAQGVKASRKRKPAIVETPLEHQPFSLGGESRPGEPQGSQGGPNLREGNLEEGHAPSADQRSDVARDLAALVEKLGAAPRSGADMANPGQVEPVHEGQLPLPTFPPSHPGSGVGAPEVSQAAQTGGPGRGRGDRVHLKGREHVLEMMIIERASVQAQARQDRSKQRRDRRYHRLERSRSERRRGTSRSRSSSSEEESGRDVLNDHSRVRRQAMRHPGRLFIQGLELMAKFVPSGCLGTVDREPDLLAAPSMPTAYLTTALLPQSRDKINQGAQREMRTLAEIMGLLMEGDLMHLADVAMQRFRAMEVALADGSGWGLARHMEVIPDARVSSVPPALRSALLQDERLHRRVFSDDKGPDRQWRAPTPYPRREAPGGRGRERKVNFGQPVASAISDGEKSPPREARQGKGEKKGNGAWRN